MSSMKPLNGVFWDQLERGDEINSLQETYLTESISTGSDGSVDQSQKSVGIGQSNGMSNRERHGNGSLIT